jgi:hypothetical protein
VSVIDYLEPIDIAYEEREGTIHAYGSRHLPCELLLEVAPVTAAGELIKSGENAISSMKPRPNMANLQQHGFSDRRGQ